VHTTIPGIVLLLQYVYFSVNQICFFSVHQLLLGWWNQRGWYGKGM